MSGRFASQIPYSPSKGEEPSRFLGRFDTSPASFFTLYKTYKSTNTQAIQRSSMMSGYDQEEK